MAVSPDIQATWFGTLPSNWKVMKLKYLAAYESGEGITSEAIEEEGAFPVYGGNGLRGYTTAFTYSGDYVLIGRQGALCGNINYASGKFWASEHAVVVKPRPKVALRWLGELLRSMNLLQYSQSAAQPGLSVEYIINLAVPVPPFGVQQAIADFLDGKTAQIDGVITKKQRMIDLLYDKRQALISEAVTKGLDPAAPTKPSRIEWIGMVPKHWSVERLKYSISKIEQGWSPQCDNRPAEDDEWGVLKVGCGNGYEFDSTEQKALPLDVAPMPEYEIKPGDILMSRGNTRELVGSASLVRNVRPMLLLCDLLYRFHALSRRADPEFLVFSLRSPHVRFQIEREASGTSASMKKVGQETIRELVLCLPPVDEQKSIITRLRPLLDRLDGTVHRIESQIAKLREYRQTLISAAVTGQIDVTTEGKR